MLARRGVPASRVRTIVNAWQPGERPLLRDEARRVLELPPGGFRVGFVWRLTREKGTDVLLDAPAILPKEAVSVSVLGDGAERQWRDARAAAVGLGSTIAAVLGAAQRMLALDVDATSSRTEGTPIVLFEAMAAGVPVVATDVGGIPDVVTGEERSQPGAGVRGVQGPFQAHPGAARKQVLLHGRSTVSVRDTCRAGAIRAQLVPDGLGPPCDRRPARLLLSDRYAACLSSRANCLGWEPRS